MAKYSLEFKLKLVKEYIDGADGYATIAKKHNIQHSILQTWISRYKALGVDGLKRSRSNNGYDTDFKLKVITDYFSSENSYQNLAIKYGIPNSSLIARWKLDYENDGIIGLQPKKKGRKPTMPSDNTKTKDARTKQEKLDDKMKIKELEQENELLRAENALIKKFQTLGIPIPEHLLKK